MDVDSDDNDVQLQGGKDLIFIQPRPPNASRVQSATKESRRTRVKRYICPTCGLPCSSPSTLRCHLRKHTGEKPYACSECGFRTAQTYSLRAHMRIHTGERPFQCKLCDYKCAYSGSLITHMRKHTGERPYGCSQCPYKAATCGSLKVHSKSHSTVTGRKPRGSCEYCVFTTEDATVFDKHMKEEHADLSQNLNKRVSRMYSCNECDYTCRLLKTLQVHQLRHKQLPNFACKSCSYKCYTRQALKTHTRRQHATDRPFFECPVCSKHFTAKASVQAHQRLHTGERPFPCPVCSYRAISKTVLKDHMIRHESESEKPFPCYLCDARFNWPHEWQAHMFTHRDENFEKSKYACPHCDYSSPVKTYLSTHMTTKHPDLVSKVNRFFCAVCKFDFKKRDSWNRHIRLRHRGQLDASSQQSVVI